MSYSSNCGQNWQCSEDYTLTVKAQIRIQILGDFKLFDYEYKLKFKFELQLQKLEIKLKLKSLQKSFALDKTLEANFTGMNLIDIRFSFS